MASSSATINKIERAHQMYREAKYSEALLYYTDALSLAKNKSQKIALHSNRAACFLKLHHFKKAAEECTLVLELDQKHTGALMLRAQTLVTLKEYHSALFDVNRLIELNPSSEVYQNLHARLKTQLSLAPIPEAEAELEEDEDEDDDLKVDWKERCTNKETDEVDVGEDDRASEEVTARKAESGSVEQTTEVGDVQKIESSEQQASSWKAIPQPKGHSRLDYSKWDKVEDESSEDDDDDDDDDDSQPQYRFRVKTIGVRAVK
ncbi:protein unc-45 A [Capsicum galapagoense]